jgi:pimeloyl-ACP methyl ester carboxylesterase
VSRLVPAAKQVVQAGVWAVRHPREPFAVAPMPRPDRLFYRAEDGWEAPLFRFPARPGGDGAPIVLVHGLVTGPEGFDLAADPSLARALHHAGYDVFLLTHRGDRGSVPPAAANPGAFDFDDIVSRDVPAALARIREATGARRALWVGHGLGGQMLVAHIANGGTPDLAAAALLCAPVRFTAPRTSVRLAALTARLLPSHWKVPLRAVHQALAPFADRSSTWGDATRDTEGSIARGLMVHGTEDVPVGLARQVATWLEAGGLCDRHDRVDYVTAIKGSRLPLWVLATDGDSLCSPNAARPVVDTVAPGAATWTVLGSRWGHLDPLIGKNAPGEVFGPLMAWLEEWRGHCWDDRAR